MVADIGLGENVFDACSPSLVRKLLDVVHREHHHRRAGSKQSNLPRRFNPIHHGHLKVQDHHIGVQLFDFLNRHHSVLCFATYSPRGMWLDVRPEETAYDGAIVDDEN